MAEKCRPGIHRAILAILPFVFSASQAEGNGVVEANQQSRPVSKRIVAHVLDLAHRSLEESIEPRLREPGRQKFVQVEVSAVHNPDLIPISFEVRFTSNRDATAEEIFLGVFSLFPPDNPGTFIVATRGRLESSGTIRVSIELPGARPTSQTLTVNVEPLSLREE